VPLDSLSTRMWIWQTQVPLRATDIVDKPRPCSKRLLAGHDKGTHHPPQPKPFMAVGACKADYSLRFLITSECDSWRIAGEHRVRPTEKRDERQLPVDGTGCRRPPGRGHARRRGIFIMKNGGGQDPYRHRVPAIPRRTRITYNGPPLSPGSPLRREELAAVLRNDIPRSAAFGL